MADRYTKANSSQIKDGTILPEDLNSTNSPSDNQILTYDIATSKFTWVTQAGGGDMSKSTYDTDDDGIVDKAETIDDGAGNSASASDVKDAVTKKHSQNTDTGTSEDSFEIGDGTDTTKYIYANNGDANKPGLRYNYSTNKWEYSNDGTTWNTIGEGIGINDVDDFTIKYSNNVLKLADRIEQNIMMNAFRLAVVGSLTQYAMVDSIMDEYEDESGVDTGASTNEDYDSVNDLYSPTPGGYTADIIPDMTGASTPSGTVSASQEYSTGYAWKAMDNDSGTHWQTATAPPEWLKYDFGSGNEKTITRYTLLDSSDTRYYPEDWTLQGSNNDSDWDVLDTQTGENTSTKQTYTFSNSTSYRYYKLNVTKANGGAGDIMVDEIEMMESIPPSNMTLISDTFTAEAVPSDARLIVFEEDVDAVTVNTDLKGYVSRDGGSTWAECTLVDEGDYENGKRILSGQVDLTQSGIGSGTSMKYKLVTANEKDLKIHGSSIIWN